MCMSLCDLDVKVQYKNPQSKFLTTMKSTLSETIIKNKKKEQQKKTHTQHVHTEELEKNLFNNLNQMLK